jgi:hypothetical protein
MPRRPKGEKRPADVIGAAVMIGRIATGEIEDLTTDDGKNAAAVALRRMGGKARGGGLSDPCWQFRSVPAGDGQPGLDCEPVNDGVRPS